MWFPEVLTENGTKKTATQATPIISTIRAIAKRDKETLMKIFVAGGVKIDYKVDKHDVQEEYVGMSFLHLAALTDCDLSFFKFLADSCGVPYMLAGKEKISPRDLVEHRRTRLKLDAASARVKLNRAQDAGAQATLLAGRLQRADLRLRKNKELLQYLSTHADDQATARHGRVNMSAILSKLSLIDSALEAADAEQKKLAQDREIQEAWRRVGQQGGNPTFEVTFTQPGPPGVHLLTSPVSGDVWVGEAEAGEPASQHPVLSAAYAMAASTGSSSRPQRLLLLGVDGPVLKSQRDIAAFSRVGRPMTLRIQLVDADPAYSIRSIGLGALPRRLPSLQLAAQAQPRITERVRQLLATEKSTFETVAHLAEPDGALLNLRQERRAVFARGVRRLDMEGWALEPPVLKLWRGCRDGADLTEGLDPESAAIALHLLALTRKLAPHFVAQICSQHKLATPISPSGGPTWDEGLYNFGSPLREARSAPDIAARDGHRGIRGSQ
jgi:hypothetical protein